MAKASAPKVVKPTKRRWLVPTFSAATFFALLTVIYNLQGDWSNLSVEKVEFEPFPLVAGNRTRVAVTLKNSGKNYAKLAAAAVDRTEKLPSEVIYDRSTVAPALVSGNGGVVRLISDLGNAAWIPTPAEAEAINRGRAPFRVLGFVEYRDRYVFLPPSVVGFCYAWDADAGGNFSVCSEKKFTYTSVQWLYQGVKVRDVPTVEVGLRAISPTTVPARYPDQRFPIKNIEAR